MGLFGTTDKEAEEIRGVVDARLPSLEEHQLLFLALARLMESEGVEDGALIAELYRRGKAESVWEKKAREG